MALLLDTVGFTMKVSESGFDPFLKGYLELSEFIAGEGIVSRFCGNKVVLFFPQLV